MQAPDHSEKQVALDHLENSNPAGKAHDYGSWKLGAEGRKESIRHF
jgi:hypothetical protein